MQKIIIGRDPSCDYVVDSPTVSRTHGEIYLNDEWVVNSYYDHSTNGSKVNGNYVHQSGYPLKAQDVISLPGDIELNVSDIVASVRPGFTGAQVPPQTIVEKRNYENTGNAYQPQPAPAAPIYAGNPSKDVGFGQALALYFKNYVNFSGRSRRKEYWYVFLWNMIFGIIPIVNVLWSLASIIPGLALSIRRIHDTGRSGWNWLLSLIPLAGPIILLIFMCQDTMPGPNKWGPCTK